MSFVQIILYPFSLLYGIGTILRNMFYDLGLKKTYHFEIPIISIGNLSVGGTGKTPTVELLIEILSPERRVAVLSRGYKRKTRGFLKAVEGTSIEDIGDEPYQMFRKFKYRLSVYVGEDRASAIDEILKDQPDLDCILLDDAYQHRRVGRSLNILLTDFSKPFYSDFVLPSGRLREPRSGANRADIVIITKVPSRDVDTSGSKSSVKRYLKKGQAILTSTITYGNAVCISGNAPLMDKENIIVFTGIANPDSFYQFLNKNYNVVSSRKFPDHWNYTLSDIKELVEEAHRNKAKLVTTEKDAIKLMSQPFTEILKDHKDSVYYFPIKMSFLEKGKEFEGILFDCLKS